MSHQQTIGGVLLIIGLFYYSLQSIKFGLWFANQNDFFHLYIAGYLAQHGGNFFALEAIQQAMQALQLPRSNPFVYPPFFALVLIPLSWLPFNTAWLVFFALSQAAFLAALTLLIKLFRPNNDPPIFWWGFMLCLSACFIPLFKTYSPGQMNTFMLLAICGSWWLIQKKREHWAGAVLGLAAAVKVAPAFMLLYLAFKRRWRAFFAGAGVIVLSVILSLIALGPGVHYDFLNMAQDMSYGQSTWAEVGMHYHVEPHNQAPSALWYRLLTDNPATSGLIHAPALAKTLSYLTALAILGVLFCRTQRRSPPHSVEYALWSLAMLLLPSLMWDHYLTQTLFAIMAALTLARNNQVNGGWVLAAGVGLMAIPYFYNLSLFKQGIFTVLMAVKLYGLLLVAWFLLRNQPQESG